MTADKDTRALGLALRRGRYLGPSTRARSYTLPVGVMFAVRKCAPAYGSQGRAIQVGVELLWRLSKPIRVPRFTPEYLVRWTFKLTPRTIKLIERLAETQYESQGQVLAACMQILKMKKVPSNQRENVKSYTHRK